MEVWLAKTRESDIPEFRRYSTFRYDSVRSTYASRIEYDTKPSNYINPINSIIIAIIFLH